MIVTRKELKNEVEKWQNDLKLLENKLNSQITELKQLLQNIPQSSTNTEIRLKELELWQSKLHSLMIDKTPANKEKLNKQFNWMKGRI